MVIEKDNGRYSNLNVPYLCAAINVLRAYPESAIPQRYTFSLDDVFESYPPENSIRYCMGYTTDSRNNLISTLGLELGEINYISGDPENLDEQERHPLAGGCYFPDAFSQRAMPFLTSGLGSNNLWTARYRVLPVPDDSGWNHYEPVQNPGTSAGCQ